MKFFTFKSMLLILLFGMISFATAASINGVVTDANSGLPIESASITIIGINPIVPDSIIYRTVSGVDGSFSFSNAIPATYYMWCEHPNYFSGSQSNVVLGDSLSVVTVNFSLFPTNSGISNEIGGTVYSVSRNTPAFIPLDGANVYLTGNGMNYTSISDSGGLYDFTNIPTGLYFVSADAPNHEPQQLIDSLWITENTVITDLDIYLTMFDSTTSTSSLSGFVYETDSSGTVGSPVYPASVTIISINPVFGDSLIYTANTNPDGSYLIDNVIPEVFNAICMASGYQTEYVYGIDLTMGSATQDFHLTSNNSGGYGSLSGWVWADSSNSNPISNFVYPATINLVGYTPMGDSLLYHTVNNPDGSYLISGILPGTYTVWCTAAGYQSQYIQNYVVANNTNRLDFSLTPTNPILYGHVFGSVFSDSSSAPVSNALIEFISIGGLNFNTFTDINGNYASPNLPAGDYYVACYIMARDSNNFYMEYYDDAHSLSSATILTTTQYDTIMGIDFGVPTTTSTANVTVNGNVKDSNNQPLENALVTAWSYWNPGTTGDSLHISTYTDAQGNYSFTINNNLPQYAYSFFMSAEKQGYNIEFWQEKATPWEADQIWVFGDTSITGINFTLDAVSSSNSISGFIIDDTRNAPLNNAFVIAADASNGQIYFTFSDSVGHYYFNHLNNNHYYLLFTANGYVPEFFDDVYVWEDATTVYASGSVANINAGLAAITPGTNMGIISGTVINANNTPLSGVLLAIKNAAGEVIGYDITDNQGAYNVNGISDGDHSVSASKVSYSSEIQDVIFNSTIHNTLVVNFDLDQTITGLPESPKNIIPTSLELMSNYPNPFNPETKISVNLPSDNRVRLVVYNILGQVVRELANTELPAGIHTFSWNGTDNTGKVVSTGVYFYMLEVNEHSIVKKMIFNK